RRDRKQLQPLALAVALQFGKLVLIGCVHFGCDNDERLRSKSAAEGCQLAGNGLVFLYRVRTAARVGDVHQMGEQAGTLDVPQELRAQSRSLAGALDESGD